MSALLCYWYLAIATNNSAGPGLYLHSQQLLGYQIPTSRVRSRRAITDNQHINTVALSSVVIGGVLEVAVVTTAEHVSHPRYLSQSAKKREKMIENIHPFGLCTCGLWAVSRSPRPACPSSPAAGAAGRAGRGSYPGWRRSLCGSGCPAGGGGCSQARRWEARRWWPAAAAATATAASWCGGAGRGRATTSHPGRLRRGHQLTDSLPPSRLSWHRGRR